MTMICTGLMLFQERGSNMYTEKKTKLLKSCLKSTGSCHTAEKVSKTSLLDSFINLENCSVFIFINIIVNLKLAKMTLDVGVFSR